MSRAQDRMSHPLDRALHRDWHGPLSRAAIARKHHMSPSGVHRHWQDMRARGLLPDGCRPHFAAVSGATVHNAAAIEPPALGNYFEDSAFAASIDRDVERSEMLAEQTGLRIPAFDGLLAALTRAHGGDRRRRVDDNAAAQLAAMERAGTVSPAALLNHARIVDRVNRRLGA